MQSQNQVLSLVLFSLLSTIHLSSNAQDSDKPQQADWSETVKYWSGAAEVSRYELKQERYGKVRNGGDAVLIYAREPFLKDRQVKDENGSGDYQVLKLNSKRHFLTGVNAYDTMVSIFQPLEKNSFGEALKVTTSIQEWCGHIFMQSNRRDGKITTAVHSYFESEEGGLFESAKGVYLEDEVWTAIRLDPVSLPVGGIQMIPGSLYARFMHKKPAAKSATAVWKKGHEKGTLTYQITYPTERRVVAIDIQDKHPYAIQAWKEGVDGDQLTTAILTHRKANFAYWEHGSIEGEKLRAELGLDR